MNQQPLDGSRRQALTAQVADALIPAAEGELSASEAGVPGVFLDEALEIRPDLAGALDEAIAALDSGTPADRLLATWEKNRPVRFQELFLLIRGAYFLNPEVLERFGYDGRSAQPLSEAIPADYLDLVSVVVSAGPRYRPIPEASPSGDVAAAAAGGR
jgi:hypothetical protein